MKNRILFALVLIFSTLAYSGLSAASGSHDSTKSDYKHVMLLVADATLNSPDIVKSLLLPDPNADFLREIGFTTVDIDTYRQQREAVIRDNFGLDFSNVSADSNGFKVIPGVAMMFPYRWSPDGTYRVLDNDGHKVNWPVHPGGYVMLILGNNVLYHGKFGGVEGKPANPGEMLTFGYYKIIRPGSKPLLVSFEQAHFPNRITPEGGITIPMEVTHPAWGAGLSRGFGALEPLPDGRAHVVSRNVLTFPPAVSN